MTPDPNAGPLFPYALVAVLFVAASVVALFLMCEAWAKFEGWLRSRVEPSNVIPFPRSGSVRVVGKDGAA